MSLLGSILGAATGRNQQDQAEANPLIGVVGGLLAQPGGIQGLMSQFAQAGLGNVFSQWIATGPNPPVSGDQIQQALGSEKLQALASRFGIDQAQVAQLVAQHLPAVVDQLTPAGKIDESSNVQSLATMLPGLLSNLNATTPPPGR